MPVSLDCPFLIAPVIFSNDYLDTYGRWYYLIVVIQNQYCTLYRIEWKRMSSYYLPFHWLIDWLLLNVNLAVFQLYQWRTTGSIPKIIAKGKRTDGTSNNLLNTIQKSKDSATPTPLKPGSGRVSCTCSNSGTRSVYLLTNHPVTKASLMLVL
jgi:hypothetical protein